MIESGNCSGGGGSARSRTNTSLENGGGGTGNGGDGGATEHSDPLTPCYQEVCHRKIMKETTRKFLHAFNSSQVTTKTDQILLIYQ